MWQQRNWKKPLSLTRPSISLNRLQVHNLRTAYLCFVPSPTGSASCVLAFKCISASSSFETCLLGLGRENSHQSTFEYFHVCQREQQNGENSHQSQIVTKFSSSRCSHSKKLWMCYCASELQFHWQLWACTFVLGHFLSENSFRFDFFPSCCRFGMHVTCFSTSSPLAIFELKTSSQIFIFGSWVFVGPLRQFLWV